MHKQVHTIFYLLLYSTKSLYHFVSIATSVLHSVTSFVLCILFMHSSLTNQKRNVLWSIIIRVYIIASCSYLCYGWLTEFAHTVNAPGMNIHLDTPDQNFCKVFQRCTSFISQFGIFNHNFLLCFI